MEPSTSSSLVGLVATEIQVGAQDPTQPNVSNTTVYVVGRLERPTLTWAVLDHMLQALLPALTPPDATDPSAAQIARKATMALQELRLRGFLRRSVAFEAHGAWPSLLAHLIADDRWAALYLKAHKLDTLSPRLQTEALEQYRYEARRWIERAQQRISILNTENDRRAALLRTPGHARLLTLTSVQFQQLFRSITPNHPAAAPRQRQIRPRQRQIRPRQRQIRPRQRQIRPRQRQIRPRQRQIRPRQRQIWPFLTPGQRQKWLRQRQMQSLL